MLNARITSIPSKFSRVTRLSLSTNFCTSLNFGVAIEKRRLTDWSDSWSDSQKVSAFQSWLAAQQAAGTLVQALCELATPQILAIDPVTIPALPGVNNVFSDMGGETTVCVTPFGHDFGGGGEGGETQGPSGPAGTLWFTAISAITAAPAGARVGDIILNGGAASYTIGGVALAIGEHAKISALSPLALNSATKGNIRGATGATGGIGGTGGTGPTGATGPAGPGLAPGGTTDQVPYKTSAADYETGWKTLAAVATSGNYGDLSSKPTIPVITSGTTDLTPGVSALPSGTIHIVYE